MTIPTFTVRGQVLEVSEDGTQIRVHLTGLLEDEKETWLPRFPQMPKWALDGTPFKAELNDEILTFEQLAKNPWAIDFCYAPIPYPRPELLREALGLDDEER